MGPGQGLRVSTSNKLPGDTGAAVHGPLSGREGGRGARLNVKREDPPLLARELWGEDGPRWGRGWSDLCAGLAAPG